MRIRRMCSLIGLAALASLMSCERGEPGTPSLPEHPPFEFGEGLQGALERTAEDAFPTPTEEQRAELLELLANTEQPGRLGRSAVARLEEYDPGLRNAILLDLVSDRFSEVGMRRKAYAWLRDRGSVGVVPRLTLRLKYEKDLWSAVCVGDTLLRYGNGSGLDAIAGVLEREAKDEAEELARSYAATLLALLPAREGWEPGVDFTADWERLAEVRSLWAAERRLDRNEDLTAPLDPELAAETWKAMRGLTSMPLRPVDDARFVLVRQRGAVVPMLLEAARDRNRYIREHALQTLSWMGVPLRPWLEANVIDYLGELNSMFGDRSLQPRVLEAMGASRMPAAVPFLTPFLEAGSRESSTAAADALLRCADSSILPQLQDWLTREPPLPLSAEARYSLLKLHGELDPTADSAELDRVNLAGGERARRDRWAQERAPQNLR